MATTPFVKVPTEEIAAIDDGLDSLEELLEPLFAKPLSETLEKLSVINRAKLCTLLPYVAHSLVMIYLKMNDVDPRSHSVMEEMKRVKTYMEKITNAEKSKQNESNQPKLDTEVANRFIKNAIASATAAASKPSTSRTIGVIGNHIRFDVQGEPMTEKAAAKIASRMEVEGQEEQSDEDEGLMVVDGVLGDETPATTTPGEGEASKTPSEPEPEPEPKKTRTPPKSPDTEPEESPPDMLLRNNRKRPRMDPFAGYDVATPSGQGTPATVVSEDFESGNSNTTGGGKRKRRKKRSKPGKSKLNPKGGDE